MLPIPVVVLQFFLLITGAIPGIPPIKYGLSACPQLPNAGVYLVLFGFVNTLKKFNSLVRSVPLGPQEKETMKAKIGNVTNMFKNPVAMEEQLTMIQVLLAIWGAVIAFPHSAEYPDGPGDDGGSCPKFMFTATYLSAFITLIIVGAIVVICVLAAVAKKLLCKGESQADEQGEGSMGGGNEPLLQTV